MSEQAYIVQFPHPGAEHRPRGPDMAWNQGPHRRKFLVAKGTYRDDRTGGRRGKVVFWGEWEGPSRVLRSWPREEGLPRYLHEPYLGRPPAGPRQNTDPWVFVSFYYSNCKQLTNRYRSITAMQRLTPGSLILFGSTLAGRFVLDTVMVVGRRLCDYRVGEPLDVEVEDAFRVATLESMRASRTGRQEIPLTLYQGATASRPFRGMFSFVPCLPAGGDGPRFARPVIRLRGTINPRSRQATSGARTPRELEEVVGAWESVKSQVLDEGLLLATQIEALGSSSEAE